MPSRGKALEQYGCRETILKQSLRLCLAYRPFGSFLPSLLLAYYLQVIDKMGGNVPATRQEPFGRIEPLDFYSLFVAYFRPSVDNNT